MKKLNGITPHCYHKFISVYSIQKYRALTHIKLTNLELVLVLRAMKTVYDLQISALVIFTGKLPDKEEPDISTILLIMDCWKSHGVQSVLI